MSFNLETAFGINRGSPTIRKYLGDKPKIRSCSSAGRVGVGGEPLEGIILGLTGELAQKMALGLQLRGTLSTPATTLLSPPIFVRLPLCQIRLGF